MVAAVTLATFAALLTPVLSPAVAIAAVEVVTAAPMGFWRFDEASGVSVGDSSGFGNTGTAQNGMTWGAGHSGSGGVFNGTSAQVQIPDSPTLGVTGTGLTLVAWVKPAAVNSYRVIVHKDSQYSLAISNGQLTYADSITWSYATIGAYGSVPAGTWSHVAVTFDGSVIRFYINAALVGSKLRAGSVADNANPVCLAAYSCMAFRFGGTLDEVAVYAQALSAAELQTLAGIGGVPTATPTLSSTLTRTPTQTVVFSATPTATMPLSSATPAVSTNTPLPTPTTTATPATPRSGPMGYWRFDEGSGAAVADSSGFGNTGTAQNGMTWGAGRVGSGGVFDGVNAQVRIPDSASVGVTGTGLTLAAWVMPAAINSYRVIVHKELQYSLAISNGQLTYADSITWSYATMGAYGSVPVGTWSHVAVTFDGTTVLFYVNGTLAGSRTRAGSVTDNANPLCLASYNCTAFRFGGTLDEVALYARALSATELQTLAGSVPTATSTLTRSMTATATLTRTPTPLSSTPTFTWTPTASSTLAKTSTPTWTATLVGSATPIASATPIRSATPVGSATPTPTATVGNAGGPVIGGCSVFPANNIWNRRIDSLPLDPSSQAYVSNIGSTAGMHPDFGSGLWGGGPIGIPLITVPGTQPFVPIAYVAYGDESDPGPYPVPSNAPIEGGSASTGDRHVLVVDAGNCTLYELYNAWPQVDGSWEADSGAVYGLGSNALRTDGWTSADAAGLPILPGLVRYDEVASGAINHALRFTVPRTRQTYLWPARHYASSSTDPTRPPMGQRFRLKAGFNISGFSAANQVILQALKTYGMFVADNGSAWYLSGAPDERWNNDDLHNLQTGVHGSDFEAVDESSLMVAPDSAQAR